MAAASWYSLAEQEFADIRGGADGEDVGFCGRAAGASFKWEFADKKKTDQCAGSSVLTRAWRTISTCCVTLAKPKPESEAAQVNRMRAAAIAFQSIADSSTPR
jgi:hypothetical protein